MLLVEIEPGIPAFVDVSIEADDSKLVMNPILEDDDSF